MESLSETTCMFTDSQLTFLNDLEQLVNESYFPSSQKQESAPDTSFTPYLSQSRKELECQFQQLILQPLDQKQDKLKSLKRQQNECETWLTSVDQVLKKLEHLKHMHQLATGKTGLIHSKCEMISKQQQDLQNAINALEHNLIPFRKYFSLQKELSQPVDVLLQSGQLPLLLEELDDCIGFFQTHPNFVESKDYCDKFIQMQNHILGLLKSEILLLLQMQTSKIIPQASEQLAPGENVFTLFYAKFQQFAQKLKPMLINLERRKHLDETSQSYLNECYQAYVNSRQSLIVPVLMMAVREMTSNTSAGTLQSVRNSATMVFQMCRDELQLYFNFFERSSSQLICLMDSLCAILYDLLRPLIIKCNHLETLAEIGHILKTEVIDDQAVAVHSELSIFVKIVDLLVQDVQERLIFRANLFIQNEIVQYQPVPGDLAYPDKLKMLDNIESERTEDKHKSMYTPSVGGLSRAYSVTSMATSVLSSNTFSDVTLMPFETSDKYGCVNEGYGYHLWYPTVRRAIMCLTKLFRTLDSSTFQALAQDVITACILTLDEAALKISARSSPLDADLFLVKHLLIIREQIAPFKIECTVREVSLDFSKVKDAAMSLFHRGNTIFSISTNNGLLSFLFEMQSSAQIVDQVLDSQKTVDMNIRAACQRLIDQCSHRLNVRVEQLRDHLPELGKQQVEGEPNDQHTSMVQNEMIEQQLVREIDLLVGDLRTHVQQIRSTMALYLCNEETEFILFKPIKGRLLRCLESLEKQIKLVFADQPLVSVQLSADSWIKLATQYSPHSS